MSDELKDAQQYAADAEEMAATPPAEMARLFAQIAIAAALERIAERLEALTSAAGNLKVETPS